ncbi:AI-2E family transporter [Bowmanella dokdonensis]|uniref:AI-2E family transporter n=1 Tax=Bowmanella dokdonensis TaxID=751969 RepID=A0A939ILV2_9ALTE|nr:AI-2E family transporter [Bowmanella dokdonensis]MBN7824608.1 AI-2E family transporter [Bowmanella dokdonensis]
MDIKASSTSRVLLTLASLVVILAGAKAASSILVPFLLSLFIALACNPLVNWARRYHMPRWLAIVVVILLFLVFGFMLARLLGNSLTQFIENLPEYKAKLGEEMGWLVRQLAVFNINLDSERIAAYMDSDEAMNALTRLLTGIGSMMTSFLLVLLILFFMLVEAATFPRKLRLAMSNPEMKARQIAKFLASLKKYLVIKGAVSIVTGFLAGLLCYLLGVDHFLLWAVMAFLLNFIPNIGSIIAAGPPVLMSLVEMGGVSAAIVAAGYLAINTLMGNLLEPRLMGRGLGLSPLMVFLSLIFWGWLLGPAGMLLAVPLTMVVKLALETSREGGWFALLLIDEKALKRNEQSSD